MKSCAEAACAGRKEVFGLLRNQDLIMQDKRIAVKQGGWQAVGTTPKPITNCRVRTPVRFQ